MAAIKLMAETFFYSLSFGMTLFSILVNPKDTGAGLIKVVYSVAGVSLLLGLGIHLSYASLTSPQIPFYIGAFICILLTYIFQGDKRSRLFLGIYVIQQLCFLAMIPLIHNHNFIFQISFFSSVLFLGSVCFSMLLGHWYLVTPKLSEKPLYRGVICIWAILIFKSLWTGYFFQFHYENKFFDFHRFTPESPSFKWMVFLMRVLWGYLVIGIMNYFAMRLVKMRSLQSATGILYAMTFFVLVGELIAYYLFFYFGKVF